MSETVLVLDAGYYPMGVVPVRKGFNYILNGKGIAIFHSEEVINLSEDTIAAPSIVVLNEAHGYKRLRKRRVRRGPIPWSKRGLMLRDSYTCAYCGEFGNTVDHVVPRKMGGKSTWENTVVACTSCNSDKGCLTVKQAGMELLITPYVPKELPTRKKVLTFTESQREFLIQNNLEHVMQAV